MDEHQSMFGTQLLSWLATNRKKLYRKVGRVVRHREKAAKLFFFFFRGILGQRWLFLPVDFFMAATSDARRSRRRASEQVFGADPCRAGLAFLTMLNQQTATHTPRIP
jgi:hypothetical protein